MKASATESLGYCELEQDKLWFYEYCSKLLYERKQAKLKRLQNSSQVNGDGLNNVRRETNRNFRYKKGNS
jgi:hypothetical protein